MEALDHVHALLHRSLPWSELPILEEGANYWLVPVELARRQEVPLARQPGNREAWFKCHAVIPVRTSHAIEVAAYAATGRLAEVMAGLAKEKEVALTGWIGHFDDVARLEWEESHAQRWRFRRVHPADVRNTSIVDTLRRAADAGAHVVVLPELTIDIDARRFIGDWLVRHPEHPFELLVAGSFHEETGDGWFNTAELWNRHGEPLLYHRKLRAYGEAAEIAEDINVGNQISILVTAAGSFSLLICKDFLDDHQSVATLLREVPVDWMLVPSYGDESSVARHADRALSLAKVGPGTCSIIANQRNIEVAAGAPCPGFVQPRSGGERLAVGTSGGAVTLVANLVNPDGAPHPPAVPDLRRARIRTVK